VRFAGSAVSGGQLPFWVTIEAGLFAQHGLEVEWQYLANTMTMNAFIANELDVISVAGPELVAAGAEGADIVAIGGVANRVVQSLFVVPAIQDPAALRGRTVGVTRFGSLSDFSARYLLRQWGLRPEEDTALVQVGGIPEIIAALLAGGIEAGVLSPPQTLQALDQGLVELANMQNQPLEYPTTLVAMRRPERPEAQETARRFVRAMVEGIHRLLTDRPLAIRALQTYTRNDDPRILDTTYETYAPTYERDLRISRDSLRTALEQLAASNPRAANADVDRLIEPRFVEELARGGLLDRLYAR
jgi:NitT/TauT family transport system substrate-binding protein